MNRHSCLYNPQISNIVPARLNYCPILEPRIYSQQSHPSQATSRAGLSEDFCPLLAKWHQKDVVSVFPGAVSSKILTLPSRLASIRELRHRGEIGSSYSLTVFQSAAFLQKASKQKNLTSRIWKKVHLEV